MKFLLLLIISCTYIFADAHVFVYHRFDDTRHKSTNTTLSELEQQFEYFKQHNYKVVPLSQIVYNINNNIEIPDNWVALTIDDAYKSFYTHGLEMFKKYNYPFSLYVYIEATNRHYGDFMTWEQVRETSKYGEIGLHSYSHPHLLNLTNEEIFADTQKAYDIFTKELGFKPKTYAYPYGEYDLRIQNQLKKFNFDAILNQSSGSISTMTNTQDIPRTALVGEVSLEEKLKYKTFDAQWIEPLSFPINGILKSIKAKVDPRYSQLKLYISGFGWRDIKVNNGIINENVNLYLPKARTRLMIGTDPFTISNHIIIKRTGHVK